jgi:hypothetical protein
VNDTNARKKAADKIKKFLTNLIPLNSLLAFSPPVVTIPAVSFAMFKICPLLNWSRICSKRIYFRRQVLILLIKVAVSFGVIDQTGMSLDLLHQHSVFLITHPKPSSLKGALEK